MAIRHPFGEIQTATMSASGAQAVSVTSEMLIIDGVTTKGTDARTLNLTIAATVQAGAILVISHESSSATTANRALAFGTGITADTQTPAQSKEMHMVFVYNGTTYNPAGAKYEEG